MKSLRILLIIMLIVKMQSAIGLPLTLDGPSRVCYSGTFSYTVNSTIDPGTKLTGVCTNCWFVINGVDKGTFDIPGPAIFNGYVIQVNFPGSGSSSNISINEYCECQGGGAYYNKSVSLGAPSGTAATIIGNSTICGTGNYTYNLTNIVPGWAESDWYGSTYLHTSQEHSTWTYVNSTDQNYNGSSTLTAIMNYTVQGITCGHL